MKRKKKPSPMELLRAEIKALREEVAALKATPPVVNHNHYHCDFWKYVGRVHRNDDSEWRQLT